jgi:hypothetical protein
MKKIKIWEIPNKIDNFGYDKIVHDSDKTDLRLHLDYTFSWGFDKEKDYEEQEKKINSFEIKKPEYTVYMWCDISGFDYWINNMKEPNYIQISISFNSQNFNENNLNELWEDIDNAISYADEISNGWCENT